MHARPTSCSLLLKGHVLRGRLEPRVDLAYNPQRLIVQPLARYGVIGNWRVGVLLDVRVEQVHEAQLGAADIPPGLACAIRPRSGSLFPYNSQWTVIEG